MCVFVYIYESVCVCVLGHVCLRAYASCMYMLLCTSMCVNNTNVYLYVFCYVCVHILCMCLLVTKAYIF